MNIDPLTFLNKKVVYLDDRERKCVGLVKVIVNRKLYISPLNRVGGDQKRALGESQYVVRAAHEVTLAA